MNENPPTGWEKVLKLGLFSVSLIPVILYLYLFVQRLPVPFSLEWGEGAGVNQIHRIISGKVVYDAPSLEFAALVYSPLYYWVTSVFAKILGNLFLAGRMVSGLASIAAAGLVMRLVWRETQNTLAAWLAAALYLGCFAISDGFYDLVRVDSLYILIILGAFLALIVARKPWGMIAAGLTIALGIHTKQSALIVFLPLLLYLIILNWKRYWLVAAAAVLGVAIPFWLINAESEGWFFYYLLDLPRQHGYSILAAVDFWIGDLFKPLGIALGISLIAVIFQQTADSDSAKSDGPKREKNAPRPRPLLIYYLLFALGAIGAAWITRATNGGGANNAMSAYAAISILFGLGYNKAEALLMKTGQNLRSAQTLLTSLVLIQFLGLIYNPFVFIPSEKELASNLSLLEEIKEKDKPVLIPYRSNLLIEAGKEPQIHVVNLFELTGYFKGDVLPEGRDLVSQIQKGICNQEYGMVVLDQPIPWFEEQLEEAYLARRTDGVLELGLLGWQGGVELTYYPRDSYDRQSCLGTIQ